MKIVTKAYDAIGWGWGGDDDARSHEGAKHRIRGYYVIRKSEAKVVIKA